MDKAHAKALAGYLAADPPSKWLTVDELPALLADWYPDADAALVRFLQANAHGSNRGRQMNAKTVEIREKILGLQDEYDVMTVRQIFYRLMSRGVVPKSEAHGYKPVQQAALSLRRLGLLPWSFIADATRWVRQVQTWDSVEDAITQTSRLYRVNRWRSQGVRIEVWLEKDALAGVIDTVTDGFGVRLMVSRGQSSDTYCWEAAQEARVAWDAAQVATVVYTLFDSDKSGRSAAHQVAAKLGTYSDGAPITVVNLAVTDRQIADWQLPTRPAKEAGQPDAVGLDAIDPDDLTQLVHDAITSHIDQAAWDQEQAIEASERDLLTKLLAR